MCVYFPPLSNNDRREYRQILAWIMSKDGRFPCMFQRGMCQPSNCHWKVSECQQIAFFRYYRPAFPKPGPTRKVIQEHDLLGKITSTKECQKVILQGNVLLHFRRLEEMLRIIAAPPEYGRSIQTRSFISGVLFGSLNDPASSLPRGVGFKVWSVLWGGTS